jgi:undecaprenyl diphosphate synthase
MNQEAAAIPNHVVIILDGNRRWAREQGLNVLTGHRKSAENVEALLERLRDRGVKTTTLWVFSTENWKRDEEQVTGIMKLAVEFIKRYRERLFSDEIRVIHLGRKDRIPQDLRQTIDDIERDTKHFTRSYLNIALDYGGRDEILRAVARIQEQGVKAEDLTEENFNQFLDTHDQPYPEPDLVIRSGGAHRMSGLMPWQGVYAEYAFIDKYFPDITSEDIDNLIDDFGSRERRFGGGK